MVTAKKVVWTEAAKKDLFNIFNRIAAKSKEMAHETAQIILSKTASLATTYAQGSPEPLLLKEPDPYKFVHAGFYKVVYSLVGDDVVIETIYHQRQDAVV
ncbi:MAG: type II toxin-antitoxin system RelE/ParE family toxin [Microscillaceae bacterium]|jgi:plasmid stabilization system protein ParE|nr:type II toxin-antitoxin system RelE/ParE family toxin [Microscillaceae bacterium]